MRILASGIERQSDAGQGVVGQAQGQFGDGVGGGRGDEEQIGLVGQFNVGGLPSFRFVVKVGDDRMTREGFEGQGGDEAEGVGGHDDGNVASVLDQQAGQIGGFIGGDGAGDAVDDALHSIIPITSFN